MIILILPGDSRTYASGLEDDREPSRSWNGHGTLPGSLPARHRMTDITLMCNRLAHVDYYIEENQNLLR